MSDRKASILIVDDRPEKLLALEAVLEDLQQNIVRASSGREALRHILSQDFAVILLDVNMPGMDGFETASLIRQRSNSRHTPIIFITAFGDEMHAAQGYSLGAVDYILAPVLPDVLRTKVAVFVDLFAKTDQIKRQAESLQRRASQMQMLAAASLEINSAMSIRRMLQTLAETARDIIGAHQALALSLVENGSPKGQAKAIGSFSDRYADWRQRDLRIDRIADRLIVPGRAALCMNESNLQIDPSWQAEIPPIRGSILAAPLTARDGNTLGVVYLTDRYEGAFTVDDEAILIQLAQMGSIAIENTLYAQERQANRIKDEFLATLSHELRTPMNAILGWTQLLRLNSHEGEVGHGLEVIERNARAQTKLIEDLLDVSRIASGKMRLNPKVATLAPIVESAIEAARPAAEAKQIAIEATLTAVNIAVYIDPDRIQQVVWNLLSNAIKFTPSGGKLVVRLDESSRNDAPHLLLEVTDTGQGIDPRFLPCVFDRFRQADSSSTRSHGGLGIGLAVVKHVVEQHGGVVSARSDGPNRGATFLVELPVAAVAGSNHSDNGSAASPSANPAPLEMDRQVAGLRVLVVDDEADTREVLAATLRQAGAIVSTVASAAEALEALSANRPDILVSDIAMPEQDGYALIAKLRQRQPEDGGDVPAIALTAYAREDDRARAFSAGFQAHLTKPVEPAALLERIATLAGRGKVNGAAHRFDKLPQIAETAR